MESLLSIILSLLGRSRLALEYTDERGMAVGLTLTRTKMALTFEKTCFAGEISTALLFRISILSSRDTLTSHVRGDIITDYGAYDDGGRD